MALTRVREHQVDTQTVGLDDAIITLNELQTGISNTDIGFVMNRGTLGNVGFKRTKYFDSSRHLIQDSNNNQA